MVRKLVGNESPRKGLRVRPPDHPPIFTLGVKIGQTVNMGFLERPKTVRRREPPINPD